MALTQVTSIGLKDGEIVNADLHSAASVALSKLASTGALGSAITATTQSASDDSTKLATTAFVQAAVTSLIDGAPGSLNTLNELAAAINDDSSYATTLTTALATKLPLAGGTLTGALNIATTSDELLTLNSTDGDEAFIGFDQSGTRKAFLGVDSNEHFILRNEVEGKSFYIQAKEGGSNYSLATLNGATSSFYYVLDTDAANTHDRKFRVVSSGAIVENSKGDAYLQVIAETDASGNDAVLRLRTYNTTNGLCRIYFADTADADIGRIEYNHTNDSMVFTTNNGTALTIDSTQKIGIGTTSPNTALDVVSSPLNATSVTTTTCKQLGLWINPAGTGDNTTGNIYNGIALSDGYAGLYGYDDGASAATGLGFFTGTASAVAERLRIDSSGDIQIKVDGSNGTSSQQGILRFYRTNYSSNMNDSRIVFDTSGGTNSNNAGLYAAVIAGKRSSDDDGSSQLSFYTCHSSQSFASKERLRIASDGEVRITSPGSNNNPAHLRLHCEDASIVADDRIGQIRFAGRDSGGATMSRTGALIQAIAAATWDTGQTNGYSATHLDFFTQNNSGTDTVAAGARLRINSDGKVIVKSHGINLECDTATTSRHYDITNASGSTGWTFGNGVTANAHQFVIYDNTAGSERFKINSGGQVTKPKSCAFNLTPNGNQSLSSGDTLSSWKTTDSRGFENTSTGGYFSSGVFTAPVTGAYFFTSTILLSGVDGTNAIHLYWQKNGSGTHTYWETRLNGNSTGYGGYEPVSGQCTMYMTAGDTCRIKIYFTGSSCSVYGTDANWGNWGGFLIG